MDELLSLAKECMLLPGPSGYEAEMAKWMEKKLSGCTDQVSMDRNGNVIGVIHGTESNPARVMLIAHMDQIGMIVTNVMENGLLRVTKNGSVPDKILPGCALIIRTINGSYIPATAGCKSYHTMTEADKNRIEPLTEQYIDIGAANKEEAQAAGVYVGCPVQYRPFFERLCGNCITGTAIDNRISCAVLVASARYLFENRPQATVYFTGTVQEEHNLRGGMVAARQIAPDAAICMDVMPDSTQPGTEGLLDNAMGTGPTVGLYNFHGRGTLNGAIAHEGLVRLAQRMADERQIHLNRFAMRGILTDSSYIQFERNEGVATIDMGIPVRYTHSSMEVCNMEDVQKLKTIVCGMLHSINSGFRFSRF